LINPTSSPSPDLDQAKEDLREGIEQSRALVRRSRVLIELSESNAAWPSDEDD
jgi:hypothetical protein